MKQCLGCGEQKDDAQFHRMKESPDGLRPRCKECRKAESTENYVANRGRIRANTKAWQKANPGRYREQLKSWNERNPGRKKEIDHASYLRYHARRLAEQAVYQKAHPEQARNMRAKRRAQMGATVHRIKKAEWEGLKEKYNGCCAYCGEPTSNPTMDHVVPLKLGGHHTVDNIVPACARCNRAKGIKSVVDFLAERQRTQGA